MILIEDFDRIQLLALDKRRSNWQDIDREFSKRKGIVEKFIVGKGNDLPKSYYNHIDSIGILPTWHPMFTTNACHCYVSHRKILEKAKKDNIKSILMLEDDLIFTKEFDEVIGKADKQLKNITDHWDMIYFGAINRWAVTEQVSENLLKIKFGGYNWHATGINNATIGNFSCLLGLPPIGPFDVLTAFFYQPTHEVYSIWPPVILQKPGHSFVCETYLDNTNLFNYQGLKDMNFKQEWYKDRYGNS